MTVKKDPETSQGKVVSTKKAMEIFDKIRKRDAELLKRLAK